MVTETLLSTIALSLLPDIVYDYLRSWFRPAVEQLLRKEHASEVLVGFVPDLSLKDQEQLLSLSETSVEEKTSALRSAQDSIKERAIDSIGQARPAKNESNLPGFGNVEQVLSELEENIVDASWLTSMVRITATPSMIRKLTRAKEVAFVAPNQETGLPSPVEVKQTDLKAVRKQEQARNRTWGIELLQLHKLWEQGITGRGVLVGHLDTGVDASHPDLQGKVREFALFDPRGRQVECSPFDSAQHGTHTAGTIVGDAKSGIAIGAAPDAELASGLVLMGGKGTVWQIIKGMEWAVSQKVRVLNMSLGGTGYNALYEYALARVVALGVFTACSIGNDGLSVTGSPGNLGIACGVGAIDHARLVADFSGGGSISHYNPLGQLMEIHKPDLVAPGVAILSSLPEGTWDYRSGTSMAAPHVSGVAALLIQARPSAPLTDIVNAIYSTARHPGSSDKRRDSRFGRGLIDPSGALEEIIK